METNGLTPHTEYKRSSAVLDRTLSPDLPSPQSSTAASRTSSRIRRTLNTNAATTTTAAGTNNSPASSPHSSSPSSSSPVSAYQLQRSRRFRSSQSVMGSKLSRRESHQASKVKKAAATAAAQEAAAKDAHSKDRAPMDVDTSRNTPTVSTVALSHTPPGDSTLSISLNHHTNGTCVNGRSTYSNSISSNDNSLVKYDHHQESKQQEDHNPHQVRTSTILQRPPLHTNTPATTHHTDNALMSPKHAPLPPAPVPSLTSPFLSPKNGPAAPLSPIASASPHARRFKSHLNAQGNGKDVNSYALPPSVRSHNHANHAHGSIRIDTGSPTSSPSDPAVIVPVDREHFNKTNVAGLASPPPLALPTSAMQQTRNPTPNPTATVSPSKTLHHHTSSHETAEQEAILFSPAYVSPPHEGAASTPSQHHPGANTSNSGTSSSGGCLAACFAAVTHSPTNHPPHPLVSVNSVQQTVVAQSNVVQTAVAAAKMKNLSSASEQIRQEAAAAAAASANATDSAVAATGVPEEEFDPFLFIKNLPPLSQAIRPAIIPVLPPRSKDLPRVSLALDLDETLVHCSTEPLHKTDLTFPVSFNGQEYVVYVRLRPHLYSFLRTISSWFEIIVFTASQRIYADKLLSLLDAKGDLIHHRLFRDSCVCVEGNFLKDLTVLGRDLSSTLIVDNSVQAFGFQLDNGIPIESWFDDDADQELLKLLPFLDHLRHLQDVRPIIKQTFKLSEFVQKL